MKDVQAQFHPDRILIEPSGVGKLSDVIVAVQNTADETDDMKPVSYTHLDVYKRQAQDSVFHHGAGLHGHPGEHDGVGHPGPLPHGDIGSQDGVLHLSLIHI